MSRRPCRRRTTVVAAAMAMSALSLGASSVPAQAGTAFVPGTGTSSAEVVGVGIRSAGAAIGFGLGQVRTRFAGAQGNASPAEVDLGLFNTLAKAPLACGYSFDKAVPPGFVPAPAVVSSGDGAAQKHTASPDQGPVRFGVQDATAAPDASATATVEGTSFQLPGVIELLGGTATSTAKMVPGTQRISAADSALEELSLGAGLVRLHGLHWTATHRTGAQNAATAGFTIDSMTVSGSDLPTGDPGQLQGGIAAANKALAGDGISLTAPTSRNGPRGVGIGPLRISVSATPALRTVLAAALIGIQPLRTALLAAAAPVQTSPDCGLARALGFGYLAVDLATLALGDDGALDLDLGGAAAGTDATAYANPFDTGYGLLHPGTPLPSVPIPGLSQPEPASAPAPVDPGAAAPTSTVPTTPAAVPVRRQVSLTTESLTCRSASGGGCAGRHGPLAAWLILALVVALAGADRLIRRLAR